MKFFKPEDFQQYCGPFNHISAKEIALIANTKLEKEGVPVYSDNTRTGVGDLYPWCESQTKEDTHKALLICIEPINKCKHPKNKVKMKDSINNGEEWYKCECGAEVRPKEFEEVK